MVLDRRFQDMKEDVKCKLNHCKQDVGKDMGKFEDKLKEENDFKFQKVKSE